ncbi:integrase domain-containing protein [Sapientia aquatica]|uniref:DNA-binding protein n=1 Tax=Sapientia aquatica TaxID=1549640 RepID=A0A4R5VP25_9BURK|nr:integrase domain-containing protein [Sapientia aquatica]TDK59279.1 DNA-binding protein [Sapientia aquatica]
MRQSIQAMFMTSALSTKKGSTLTRVALHGTFVTLEHIASKGGWGPKFGPGNITQKQFKKYVEVRLSQGIQARTIQNEVSHIRRAIVGAGRSLDAHTIFSNDKLGVPKSTRIGHGIAIPIDRYLHAISLASATVAALMRLQYNMGLRMEEAIASKDSLKTWLSILKSGGSELTISAGTKGGKIRAVYIHPENREAVVIAIAAALGVTENGRSHFYPNSKNDASAKTTYGKNLSELGLAGEASSHSMRRAFAVENFLLYLKQGWNAKAGLARVSQDLGHGDGRGRWVWNNYIKHSLPPESTALLVGDKSILHNVSE